MNKKVYDQIRANTVILPNKGRTKFLSQIQDPTHLNIIYQLELVVNNSTPIIMKSVLDALYDQYEDIMDYEAL